MRVSAFVVCIFLAFSGCVDQDFDMPPAGGDDPGLTPTLTIAELRAMHVLGQYEQLGDDIIRATVISNDEAGNFYKQLVIQDETGGIEMRIDVTDLYSQYPPGRQVYVKLKDLWLGDFNGLIQIGGAVTGTGSNTELVRIPESLLNDILLKGKYGNVVTPKERSVTQLTAADVSTLITLNDVQFIQAHAGATYADPVNELTLNREIEDCNKNRLLVRNSGFATFAGSLTPEGKGTITGVLGVFGTDLQLFIRDLADVNMPGERCQIGGGTTLTIKSLRDTYAGGQGTAPDGAIRGVVISDRTTGNTTGANLYIQDQTGGIVIRFSGTHTFNLGDDLVLDVSQLELSEFNGLLQVNNVPVANGTVAGQAALPSPRTATVNEILTNANTWESTRVKIVNATLGGATTYNGNVTVSDASGSMIMFTRSAASFSSDALPTGNVEITAIVSDFNAPQLVINSPSDITGGGGTGGQDIDVSFTEFANNTDISLPGWLNVAVKGTRVWRVQTFNTDHYAQATAFNDTAPEMETWLITPAIDVSKPKWLSFITAKAFWVHDGFSLLASTDFDGSNIQAATWSPLSATVAGESDTDHAWIPSGDIDLEQFSQPVYIAFKYVGSGPGGQTTSYRVDEIKVREK